MRLVQHNDEPVKDQDLLGRDDFIKRLATQIAHCSPPQVFGVHGEWGAGKTSLLRRLQWHLSDSELKGKELKKAQQGARDQNQLVPSEHAEATFTVWFEAWRYQHEPVPITALLQEMRLQFGLAMKALDSLKAGSVIALKTLAGAFDTVAACVGMESLKLLNPEGILKSAQAYDKEHLR